MLNGISSRLSRHIHNMARGLLLILIQGIS